ncbi:uncharacterized protein RAG0_16350 [Rhynchosporium agropyri]|uniref:Uncharacterized protein n=1 Tax=Rhynchosporium agropyri TaxID=914238 RepID=A0A1E1LPY0_9HELO|nr:uncharacterized protein RAG0_16350 [Rhynchosporium agropyri]
MSQCPKIVWQNCYVEFGVLSLEVCPQIFQNPTV